MRCAVCHRQIDKPTALSNGLPVGPVCAVKLHLITPKPKRVNLSEIYRGMSKRNKALWQAQQDLFEALNT